MQLCTLHIWPSLKACIVDLSPALTDRYSPSWPPMGHTQKWTVYEKPWVDANFSPWSEEKCKFWCENSHISMEQTYQNAQRTQQFCTVVTPLGWVYELENCFFALLGFLALRLLGIKLLNHRAKNEDHFLCFLTSPALQSLFLSARVSVKHSVTCPCWSKRNTQRS